MGFWVLRKMAAEVASGGQGIVKDKVWLAVHGAIEPFLRPDDVVLAPRGDWAPFPCAVHLYDAIIDLADASVLILHKGRMTGLAKPALARIAENWTCLYANAVFVVLASPPRLRLSPRRIGEIVHLRRLRDHLRSRELRRLPATIFYIHLPKAGGTSVLHALRKTFRSSVYFSTAEAFATNPPAPGEYDLVGLHARAALVLDLVRPGDVVAGLLREPSTRFFSAIVHGRRPNEDIETLTASQHAMRRMSVADFLATPHGAAEAQLQMIMLGTTGVCTGGDLADDAMLARALSLVGRPDALFAPQAAAGPFLAALMTRVNLKPPSLPRLNLGDRGDYAAYAEEFMAARALLERHNAEERRLYDAVCHHFGHEV